jgi:hypothetical protein
MDTLRAELTPPHQERVCAFREVDEKVAPSGTGQNYDFVLQSQEFLTVSVAANMDLFSYFFTFSDFSYHLSYIKRTQF